MIVLDFILLFLFLLLLGKAAGITVENAEKLSTLLNIGTFSIAFLLISFLTSLPEFAVSVVSSFSNNGEVAAGNVFGANVADILLIFGVSAFLYKIKIRKEMINDISVAVIITTAVSLYIFFVVLTSASLGFLEGAVLLLLFLAYVVFFKKKKEHHKAEVRTKKEAVLSFIFFLLGIALLLVSSDLVLDYSVRIAHFFNVATGFIGASIISIGTTLPELSVSLQAVKRKNYDIIIGTCIGSTLTNLCFVLGTALIINPITLSPPVFVPIILFALLANLLFLCLAFVKKELRRWTGVLFIILYIIYLATTSYSQLQSINI
jgi:cation:H+ antiporter